MNQNVDLKKIEKSVYLAYHKDGLWDIFLGLTMLSMGLSMLFNQFIILIAVIPILSTSAIGIKRAFTRPRLGYAKFSKQREEKEKSNLTRLTLLFTFTFLAGIVAFWGYMGDSDIQQLIRDLRLLPLGFVIALSIGVIGALFQIKRFIIYGLLIFLMFLLGHFLNSDPAAYMILPGIIFLVIGVVLMIRFMKKYPKSSNGGVYNVN